MSKPLAEVIVLAGPSGSGKTFLSTRTGIPALSLDDFYRDDDASNLPYLSHGVVDWDDPRSWDASEAFTALYDLCYQGEATIPIYDIPTNRRTGERTIMLGEHRVVIAEGIFASTLIPRLAENNILAGAICIARSPLRNAWFRLLRDVSEGRKSLPILLYRGVRLAHSEPTKVSRWIADGCTPARSLDEAEQMALKLAGRTQE